MLAIRLFSHKIFYDSFFYTWFFTHLIGFHVIHFFIRLIFFVILFAIHFFRIISYDSFDSFFFSPIFRCDYLRSFFVHVNLDKIRISFDSFFPTWFFTWFICHLIHPPPMWFLTWFNFHDSVFTHGLPRFVFFPCDSSHNWICPMWISIWFTINTSSYDVSTF